MEFRERSKKFKEQAIPMVVEEASRMFYQGFEIGAVKARLKDKYPSISVVDINDSVDRAFSDVGSKEESFKKLKEKFIKKEYMYNNKFFSNNLEVDWVDKASGTADLILHWPDGNGKVGFTINKNNNNIKDINIIKLPNDYQGVSHGQAMMDINQEIKYYIGPEVKRKLFESYKERLNNFKEMNYIIGMNVRLDGNLSGKIIDKQFDRILKKNVYTIDTRDGKKRISEEDLKLFNESFIKKESYKEGAAEGEWYAVDPNKNSTIIKIFPNYNTAKRWANQQSTNTNLVSKTEYDKYWKKESFNEAFTFTSPSDVQKFLQSNKNFSKDWSVEDMAAFTKQDVKYVKSLAQNAYAGGLVNYNNGKYSALKESYKEKLISFDCQCGNKDPKKTYEYDGALGYEAVVCRKCGRIHDDAGIHPADSWSKKYIESYKERLNNFKEISKIDISKIKQTPSNYLVRVDNPEQADILDTNSGKYYQIWGTVMFFNGSEWIPLKNKKESYTKKESLTLDDVALEKYGKRFKDLTSEEKKYVNYVYAEWSDDDYDEGYKKKESYKERLQSLKESLFNFYKFDGKVKFPNKISDDTLKMWFGRNTFESKSREELLKDFLSTIKQRNKDALDLLFEKSRDAIDNNLQKYDGIKESFTKKESITKSNYLRVIANFIKVAKDEGDNYAINEVRKQMSMLEDDINNKKTHESNIDRLVREILADYGYKVIGDTTVVLQESYKESVKGDRISAFNYFLKNLEIEDISVNSCRTFNNLIRLTSEQYFNGITKLAGKILSNVAYVSRNGINDNIKQELISQINQFKNELINTNAESYKDKIQNFKEKKYLTIWVANKDVSEFERQIRRDFTWDKDQKFGGGKAYWFDEENPDALEREITKLLPNIHMRFELEESLKEGYVQITGPFNIPKTKARLQQLCNDFGLQMTNDGRIDFNDNRSLLKREINELLGELKNLGVSYRLVESYKERLNKLNKK